MNHLVIGLGGTGGKSIRALRKLIYSERRKRDDNNTNEIEYLYVDSSSEMMSQTDPSWKVLGTSVQLSQASQLRITGEDLAGLLANINNYPGIRGWIGSEGIWREILGTIVGEALGGQKRRLGRFLFARQVNEFNNQARSLVQNLQSNGASNVTFHVVAGLAGGTGSGCVLDVVAQLRKIFTDSQKYRIMLYLLLPDQYPPPNWDTGNYHANGFAALTELNSLSTGAYKPIDVTSGLTLNLKDPFNGAYLIGSENENGYVAKVASEVPQIIAEFLFQKIFVAGTVGLTSIGRMENAENGDGTPETSASSNTGERSKRFLSFGIKRITIPEEEIKEFLTLSFAQQGSHQLRYNNWQESLGFIYEPKNLDTNAIVRAADVQSDWKINDIYLILEESILVSDDPKRQWKSIHTEWESVTPAFKRLAQEQDAKNWLTYLSSSFQKRYDESFRNLGVKEFYRTKGLAKTDMAREVRRLVETRLLDDWKNGIRSLYDITRIVDSLLQLLDERLEAIEGQRLKIDQRLDEVRLQAAGNINEWSSVGILGKAFGKRENIFERQALLLQSLYSDLTRFEATFFAKSLLLEIQSEIRDLKSAIDGLNATINEATSSISRELEERLREKNESDAKGHVIRFYDANVVKGSVKELTTEETIQETHASFVRSCIIGKVGDDPSLTKLSQRLRTADLIDSIITASEQSALTAHANYVIESRKKVLGISILDKLEERYGSDLPGLRLKIHELVNQAGTFLTINPAERDKTAPGIPSGAQVLVAKTIVILPESKKQDGFVGELKGAFKGAMSGDLEFLETSHQQNEITILTLKNLFPVRMIGILPFLQERYNQRVASNPERLEMELHTSGKLASYPSLFAPSSSDLRLAAGENILLGIAFCLIHTSSKGSLIFLSQDDDELDNPPVDLGSSILTAVGTIDFGTVDQLDREVKKLLSKPYDPAKLELAIKEAVNEVKSDMGSNLSDPAYLQLVECARSALKVIREAT